MGDTPNTQLLPPGSNANVFIPYHTVIGGEMIAKASSEAFVTDMRQISAAAQRNSDAWSEIAQASARRSMDFYTAVAFNNISQDQSGATSSQFGTAPTAQGVGAKQTASSPSSMAGIDNANLNSTQAGTDANSAIMSALAKLTDAVNALQLAAAGKGAAAAAS